MTIDEKLVSFLEMGLKLAQENLQTAKKQHSNNPTSKNEERIDFLVKYVEWLNDLLEQAKRKYNVKDENTQKEKGVM